MKFVGVRVSLPSSSSTTPYLYNSIIMAALLCGYWPVLFHIDEYLAPVALVLFL